MAFKHQAHKAVSEPHDRERIRSEQLAIAYRQARASILPLLFGAMIILYLFANTSAAGYAATWFGVVMGTLVWRLLVFRYTKNGSNDAKEHHFSVMMYVSALAWGSAALFIHQAASQPQQLFIIFMISGIAAVAAGTLASVLRVAVIFLSLLLLPLAIVLFGEGTPEFQVMGLFVVLFLVLMGGVARRIYENIRSTIETKLLHQKAKEALALSEEQFEAIFKEAPAGIFYYDMEGIVLESNEEMLQILRISREQMIGLDMKTLPDKSLEEALQAPAKGEKGYYEGPYTTMIRQHQLWVTLRTSPIYDAQRSIVGGVAIVTDISERVRVEEQMKHQAYHDVLTGLPNRILLKDRIEQALAHYHRSGNRIAVMFLDLDHFKSVNDSLGHQVGDALLIETAERLKSVCREEDTVARLGGDEFVILLSHLGKDPQKAAERAEAVAEKIHLALSVPFAVGESESLSSASSIGIAVISSEEHTADDLLKHADTAMYQAKKEGRGTTRFYLEQMEQWIKKRLFLENGLRSAVPNGELELNYQPVIDIATKKIIGAEALLRWNHPELGRVMPDEMITIAEESGLIVPIGEWVLRRACADFVRWRSSGRSGSLQLERIAINVSAVQFRQNDFVEKVIRIVAETGILPSMLELELTESMIIDKIDTVVEKMERLRKAGINLSMDDFGTGYSSLAYLKRLPFTTLKIDRSFIRDIMSDRDDAALVETILSMASIFKLDVIAEGVETIDQFKFLETHGCQYFQGYLCSRPVHAPTFEALLDTDVQHCSAP